MYRVMIVGGLGFIGSHFVDELLHRGYENIVVVDIAPYPSYLLCLWKDKVNVITCDATNMHAMRNYILGQGVEIVYNFGVLNLPHSLAFPYENFRNNVEISLSLCELLRKKYYNKLIQCSSSEVYGTAKIFPMDENHPCHPLTPYAASKMACDHLVTSYYNAFECPSFIVRPFNTYGPRQKMGTYAGVIPLTIDRLMNKKEAIVYGDGLQTRDYVYVEDLVKAIANIMELGDEHFTAMVCNIATSTPVSILDLMHELVDLVGDKAPISFSLPRTADVRNHTGSSFLAKVLLNFNPRTDFSEGLKKTVDWYLNC